MGITSQLDVYQVTFADPLSQPKAPTMGMSASKLDRGAIEASWPGLMNHAFFYAMWMPFALLPGEGMAPGCSMGKKQASRSS